MKRTVLSILFFTLLTLNSKSQKDRTTFSLQDSVFETGAVLRTYSARFEIGSCQLHEYGFEFLDSLVLFLHSNRALVIQINRHDFKPDPRQSMRAAKCRAKAIADYLVTKGINRERLMLNGYDGTQPIYTQKQIDMANTRERKEEMRHINIRTEFVITATK